MQDLIISYFKYNVVEDKTLDLAISKSELEVKRDLPFSGLLPRQLQGPGLSQTKTQESRASSGSSTDFPCH